MMTGEELSELGAAMYQVKSWKSRLAMDMDVYVSTINRWINGETPISKKNELAIRSIHTSRMIEAKLIQRKPKREKLSLIVRDAIDLD